MRKKYYPTHDKRESVKSAMYWRISNMSFLCKICGIVDVD